MTHDTTESRAVQSSYGFRLMSSEPAYTPQALVKLGFNSQADLRYQSLLDENADPRLWIALDPKPH